MTAARYATPGPRIHIALSLSCVSLIRLARVVLLYVVLATRPRIRSFGPVVHWTTNQIDAE